MSGTPTYTLLVVYHEREAADLAERVEAASTPGDPTYGRALDRAALLARVAPDPVAVSQISAWLQTHGITPLSGPSPSPQLGLFTATRAQCVDALGQGVATFLDRTHPLAASRLDWRMPLHLAGYVRQIRLWSGAADALKFEGSDWLDPAKAAELGAAAPDAVGGLTPADVAQIYDFPDELTGREECIALLMLSPAPDQADLLGFWAAHGVDRGPSGNVSVVNVGPPPTQASQLGRMESTMTAQWAGAMAPDAKLVFYLVDPAAFDDPWVPFLAAVIADDRHRPTVACTSWLRSERNYYNRFGAAVIQSFLVQCAAIGVTVITASGDWGCFDSFPSRLAAGGVAVADTPWPQAVFPATEPLVLAVGGTMITARDPLTEVAWSGPLPPGLDVAFQTFATGGGFSGHVGVPAWQHEHLTLGPDHTLARAFSRGPDWPAVLAYGRGVPDVALAAAGRAIQRPGDRALTSDGYRALVGGKWLDYAGGTSVAAPIWAAITALLNEARRAAAGTPRPMGFANPTFYGLPPKSRDPEHPFRDVVAGHNDIEVRTLILNHAGVFKATIRRIPGYQSASGWDPVTGLGVPRVRKLAEVVSALVRPTAAPAEP